MSAPTTHACVAIASEVARLVDSDEVAVFPVMSDELEAAFGQKNFLNRAEMVLGWADRLECRKFVTAQDIVDVRFRCFLCSSGF